MREHCTPGVPDEALDHRARRGRSAGVVDGFAELVASRVDFGWSASLLTFMFQGMPGSAATVGARMRDEVGRIYSTFVTRVVRKPRSSAALGRLPILIGSLDVPTFKGRRASISDVRVNGGLHVHAVLVVAPGSRLTSSVAEHFRSNDILYRHGGERIARIHVEPVETDPRRVTRYAMKAIAGGRVTYDDGLILFPRAVSELGA
jgi:hypothetical protein